MFEVELQLIREPKVPVFAETISPESFAGKSIEEIMHLPILEGNTETEISSFFKVKLTGEESKSPENINITINGDLSKFRYVGKGMSGGKITINGNVGFYAGQQMKGGSITVNGNADSWAGSEMTGGQIEVSGNAGDYLASPYRGSTKGVTNSTLVIHGNVGNEAGRWMKDGLISVDGNAGQFLGINMQDGTILVRGSCVGRVGFGMKGGRIIILGEVGEMLPSFTYTEMREKAKFGKEKVSASFYVYTGDSLENGNGRIFVSRCRNRHLNPENEVFAETLSVNRLALPVVEKIMVNAKRLGVEVVKHETGAVIIDAGVNARGGEEAGILVTLACLGGLAELSIGKETYGNMELPTIYETTKGHPSAVTLGSQFAGWAIKTDDYFAIGSGPARAISLQPKKLYEKLCYHDDADVAVLLLEADKLPTGSAVRYIAEACRVRTESLYIIVASTSSIVGSVQVAGRIVETGIHKLGEVGFNTNKILTGRGKAPVAPVHPRSEVAMGITNDMILYGGDVHYEVSCRTDDEIINVIDEVPSLASRDYGKPFYETFRSAGGDFYKIDPGLFAPAKITVRNMKTGNMFTAGRINVEVLKQSLALLKSP